MLQLIAQHLELADQLVDLVHRIERDALQQQTEIVDHRLAVAIGNLPPGLGDIAAHQLANATLDLVADPFEAVRFTPKDTHVSSSPNRPLKPAPAFQAPCSGKLARIM